jgi:hypothetical protein
MTARSILQTLLVTTTCILSAKLCSAASVYPSTYPYEKNPFKVPSLPEKDPDESILTEGGYLNRLTRCDPYSDDRAAYKDPALHKESYAAQKYAGFLECRPQGFLKFPDGRARIWHTRNCSSLTAISIISKALFSGKIAGKTICTDCCKDVEGLLQLADMAPARETIIQTYVTVGSCGIPSEPAYCALSTAASRCLEYFPGNDPNGLGKTNARRGTFGCYDNVYAWMMTCSLFKVKSLFLSTFLTLWEPNAYLTTLTYEQLMVLEGIWVQPDRVCYPYSYYNPAVEQQVSTPSSAFTVAWIETTLILMGMAAH